MICCLIENPAAEKRELNPYFLTWSLQQLEDEESDSSSSSSAEEQEELELPELSPSSSSSSLSESSSLELDSESLSSSSSSSWAGRCLAVPALTLEEDEAAEVPMAFLWLEEALLLREVPGWWLFSNACRRCWRI